MEKSFSFCIKEDQWGSDFITVRADGKVVREGEDRKENYAYQGETWTWTDFVEKYSNSTERGYTEAVAFILDLLNPKS